jgi:ATP-dependent DNA helicase RecG
LRLFLLEGVLIVERYRDRLEFSNPGTLLLGIDQILKGGISECRNKKLQDMFALLGYGEKAGSGIDKIRQGWASQKWRWPIIQEHFRPDRVRLILPMVSLLPEASLTRLRTVLGENLAGLDGRQIQALVTADVEGSVTNQRLQQFCADHTADITRLLQDLVAKGLLEKDGYGRWASYRLSERLAGSGHNEEGTPDITAEDSRHNGTTPVAAEQGPGIAPENDPALLAIAEPARKRRRLDPDEMWRLIRALCQGRFLTFRQLATLLGREPNGLQRWTLRPMAQEKQLVMAYPETPNHPKQAYKTNPDWREP